MPPHSLFCVAKKKKGRERQKRKGFKAETIKRLSPRSKYYCFRHSRASRIQKFFLSANHGGRQYSFPLSRPPTLKSISAAQMSMLVHSKKPFLFPSVWPETGYTWALRALICKKSLLIYSESYEGIPYYYHRQRLTLTLYVRDSLEDKHSMLFIYFYLM